MKQAAKGLLLQYVCNALKIKFTSTNTISYLLDVINESDESYINYPQKRFTGYVYPVRLCIKKAIQSAG